MPRSRGRLLAAAVLVVVSVVWLRINGPVEGPVLVVVSPDHGLTVADLPALAALVLALGLAAPAVVEAWRARAGASG